MKNTTKNPVEIGTIIRATLRPQDLLPAFLIELKRLSPSDHESYLRSVWEQDRELAHILNGCTTSLHLSNIQDDHSFWNEELCSEILFELIDMLDSLSPEGVYFGAHEGDGSDFGFWPYDIDQAV
jgi:hypothetical protein